MVRKSNKPSRLTVVSEYQKNGRAWYECVCECGKRCKARKYCVETGSTRSCGCLKFDVCLTHGMSYTREHRIWVKMRHRCENPKNDRYKDYGGRGISVCERWSSFENFFADIGTIAPGLQLDRIDNNGDYSPDNCRIVTNKINMRNTRSNVAVVQLTPEGAEVARFGSIAVAAETLGFKPQMISRVLSGERKTTGGFRWQKINQEKIK